LGPRFTGSNPVKVMDFKDDKNPLQTFLLRGGKAGGPMS
jgi:hypothetical protein